MDFNDDYSYMWSDDYLTDNFYDCHNICRPNKTIVGDFWDLYSCYSNCGGSVVPSVYEY
jgi:hypothetical protein